MTIKPTNTETNYLDATWTFSEDSDDFLRELNIIYRKIATAVNDREIARYDVIDQGTAPVTPPGFERLTGQQWAGTNNQIKRAGFRKVVLFPALVVGTNTQPHNLGTITTFTFTKIECELQNAAASSFAPLSNPCDDDCFDINGANVRIILPAGSPWIGYTAVVILEYLKNQ